MISHSIRPERLGFLALILMLAAPAFTSAQPAALKYPELPEARRAAIAQMLPAQPAGFGVPCSDRAVWASAAQYFQSSVERANTLIASPLPPWDDQAYLRYSRDGDRNEGQAMLGRHNGQLTPLVLAECSQWNGKYLPRIAEQLDAISAINRNNTERPRRGCGRFSPPPRVSEFPTPAPAASPSPRHGQIPRAANTGSFQSGR